LKYVFQKVVYESLKVGPCK